MLALGKVASQQQSGTSNPLDQIKLVNADQIFQGKEGNKLVFKSSIKTRSALKNKNQTVDDTEIQDSSNELQESLAIHSMAQEALSTSMKGAQSKNNLKLRRSVRPNKNILQN